MRTAWLAAGSTAGVVGTVGAPPSRARSTATASSTADSTPAVMVSTNDERRVSQGRRRPGPARRPAGPRTRCRAPAGAGAVPVSAAWAVATRASQEG
jgi:hypothetical protein